MCAIKISLYIIHYSTQISIPKTKNTMKKPMIPLLLLCFCFLNLSSSTWATTTTTSSSPDSVYESLLQCLTKQTNSNTISNILFAQNNKSYTSVLRAYIRNARFNTSSTPKPLIIITPLTESHVSAAVICSKQLDFQLKVRSGGHDYEGISYMSVSATPFFILDMFNLRSIEIDMKTETAWVETGATLGELYYKIWKTSNVHAFPAGVCPTVGVGGHISGGGYGNMVRKFGLTIDNVLDAKTVDVNGRIMDRKSMGEDLFWAIRGGGGGSFGVILSYKIKLVRVPEVVTVFRAERLLSENATDIVYKYQMVAPKTDRNLFMRMLLQPVTRNKIHTVRASIVTMYLGDADSLVSLLGKEFPELGLKKEDCNETNWIGSALWWDSSTNTIPEKFLDRNPDSANFLKRKSDYIQTPIPKYALNLLWKTMMELGKPGLVLNPYGGRMDEIDSTETAFAHRKGNLFKIQYSVNWNENTPEIEKNFTTQMKTLHSFLTPFVSKNPRIAYLNYRDLDIGTNDNGEVVDEVYNQGKVYGEKYFDSNFDRLVKVKTMVDPENFFRNEQSIPPLPRSVVSGDDRSGSGSGVTRLWSSNKTTAHKLLEVLCVCFFWIWRS